MPRSPGASLRAGQFVAESARQGIVATDIADGNSDFLEFKLFPLDILCRTMPNMLTAQEIKAIRKKLNLTQKELAEELGVTLCTVGRYECGARRCLGMAAKQIRKLAEGKLYKQPS